MTSFAPTPSLAAPVSTWNLVRSWIAIIPLICYANGGVLGGVANLPLHQVLMAGASFIALIFVLGKSAQVWNASMRAKLIIALPILAVLSILWSDSTSQTITGSIPLLCFTLFAIYMAEVMHPEEQLSVIMLFTAVVVPLSLALAVAVPSVGVGGGDNGWCGIFGNKQPCAFDTTLLLVTTLHWKPTAPLQKPIRAIVFLLCLVLIIMSKSRTGWLLTAVALALSLLLWILQKLSPKDVLVMTAGLIPVAGGLLFLVTSYSREILASVGKDPTLSQRTIIWAAVWDEIVRSPWHGYGYNAFWRGLAGPSHTVVLIAGWPIAQGQNGYLDLWVQLGVLSVLLVALTTWISGIDALRAFRHASNAAFVRWSIIVIVLMLIYDINESEMGAPKLGWFLFLLACIGLKNQATEQTARMDVPVPQRKLSQIAFGVAR